MAALSDGFIALPGGLGTLEELAEVASWAQLGLHAKPIGLLGPTGYWDRARSPGSTTPSTEGFIAPEHRGLIVVDPTSDLLTRFSSGSAGAARGSTRRRALGRRRRSLGRLRRRPGIGRRPGCREEPRRRRPGSRDVRDLRRAERVLADSTSGWPMTTRTTSLEPTSSTIAASSGSRAVGTSVRIVLATASSSDGSRQNRLPPDVTLSRIATMTSCCRAARVKSVSPSPLRIRA